MLLNALFPAGLIADRKPLRRAWSTAMVLSVMVNLLILVQPIFMLHVYDYVLPSQSQITLLLLTGIALFVVIISSLMDYLRSRLLIDIGRELDVQLRERAFRGALEQAVATRRFSRAAFMQDLETLRGFISGPSAVALMDLPWTPIYMIALFLLSPWLGVLSLVVAIAVIFMALLNERTLKPLVERTNNASQASAKLADDMLQSAPASQSMGFTGALLGRWASSTRYAARLGEVVAIENSRASSIVRSLRLSMQILSLALAAYLVLHGKMTPGTIVAASLIGARAIGPIEAVITGWRRFLQARVSLSQLQTMVFTADWMESNFTTLPAPKGAIQVQGASVADQERRLYMLQNVSFATPAGAFVGIVGRSGSGKTTLIHLIAGAANPSAGAIRIDGSETTQWRREVIGEHIGFMPQSVQLHRGTVAENIRRFGPVDDEGVLAAAMLSGAHTMIQSLPNGYDTDIGDGGAQLSGGQRQRIGLARACYGDPAIYVLDEPLAHLDGEAEEQFWRMVVELRKRRKTIYLVAHKPSQLRGADYIVVLNEGRLTKFGPANEILPTLVSPPPAAAAAKKVS